jgi:hypothetical protein
MTGSGKATVFYGVTYDDVSTDGSSLGSYNFNLSNYRDVAITTENQTGLAANFSFTLRVPIYNNQNQQGNYNGYSVVYALISVKDANAIVDSEVPTVNPLDPGPIQFIVDTKLATVTFIGDGNIIDRYTDVPLVFGALDSRDKTKPDGIGLYVEGPFGTLYINDFTQPSRAIVTNLNTLRSNQNQQ